MEAPDIDPAFSPSYLALQRSGELKRRALELWNVMKRCELCPRQCRANRLKGERGFCQSTADLEVSAYHPHYGEKKPLVGRGDSGTIFLAHCSLRCVFCMNWQTSQGEREPAQSVEGLAAMMLRLQEMGCHNINVVTPSHYSPHILLALDLAAAQGLRLPLVYNTCGWARREFRVCTVLHRTVLRSRSD